MVKDKFSVLIRCRNEERWIGHCIQSVIDHLDKPEIIVVDNNSNDETLNIINHFIEDPKLNSKNNKKKYTDIKIFNITNYSPGKSLNLGIKKAKYENILILSAHCVLKKISTKNLVKDLKDYRAIFGNQIPLWNGKKISKRYIWSHFVNKRVKNMYSNLEERYFLHNALSVYKKNFLKKNLFNEKLAGKEDRYWVNNIVKKKNQFLYEPNLVAEHHYTENGNTWKGIG